MLRYKGPLVMIFALAALAPFTLADVDSHVRIVRLSYVAGDAQLESGAGFQNATLNVPVVQGDILRTGEDGLVEVQFEDGGTVRLGPNTEVTFSEMGLMSSGATVTSVNLDQGEVEFNIASRNENQFLVNAGGKNIVLKHSSRFRIGATNADPLEVVVWKGEVDVQNPADGGQIAVKKNETFAQDLLDPGKYTLDRGADADSLDQWSQERENYLNASAPKSQYPYQYGVGDMNYYGQYQDLPGYGSMWQPYGVGVGWDPFMNGYWNDAPGGGYLWISSYPWGWMPYRYGQWVFINGRGWFWQPGGWNNGWHNVPPVLNPPQGFRGPVPPLLATKAPGRPGMPASGSPRANPGGSGGVNSQGEPLPVRRIVTEEDLRRGSENASPGGMENQHILGRPIVAGRQVSSAPQPAKPSNTAAPAPAQQRAPAPPARTTAPSPRASAPAPSMSSSSSSHSSAPAPSSTGGRH